MRRLALCWLIFGFCASTLEGLPAADATANTTTNAAAADAATADAVAADATENVATDAAARPSLIELQDGIFKGLQRVPEFQVLAQKAQELDIKAVYLFGGAAAALAHYVHRDLVHQHMQQLAPMGLSHQASQEQSAPTFDAALPNTPPFDVSLQSAPAFDAALPNTPPFDVSSQSPPPFDETEFNYTLWSMLFYNQDIDIVVDTKDVQKIQHLDTAITAVATSNFKWDFWSLHTAYNNRPALLTSQDFAHQHTDSHSTILMPIYLSGHQTATSLTVKSPLPKNIRTTTQSQPPLKKASRTSTQSQPPQQQPQIYDLRNKFLNESPFDTTKASGSHAIQFLTDVLEKKLSCYYSAKHRQSPRYKKGDNPEIFFAIRTLTKAFQYGLDIPDDCMNRIQKIFKNFKADRDLKTDYSQYWIEKNAKKLYTQSIDLERSQRVLQQLGALEILKNIKGNTTEVNSMAWWLNRQPLLSRPIKQPASLPAELSTSIEQPTALPEKLTTPLPWPGTSTSTSTNTNVSANADVDTGTGTDADLNKSAALDNTTAAQLGLRYVVHSTKKIEAYESIMNSHDRRPNVFISRQGASAEAASYGEGFYTTQVETANACAKPRGGIYGPLSICFRVHPQARQGVDFFIPHSKNGWSKTEVVFTNKVALQIVNDVLSMNAHYFKSWLTYEGSIDEKIKRLNSFEKVILFLLKRYPEKEEAFVQGLLKLSTSMSAKQHIKFWTEHLHIVPSRHIAANNKKFLPPKLESWVHSLWKNKMSKIALKNFALFIDYLDDLEYYTGSTNQNKDFTLLKRLEKLKDDFIHKAVKFSAQLSLGEYFEFWWTGRLLISSYSNVAQNYKKFISPRMERFIHNISVFDEAGKSEEEKPIREEFMHIIEHFITLSIYGQTYEHWLWLLETLLRKIEKAQLHQASGVKLNLDFEALLARAITQLSIGKDSWPSELALLWKAAVLRNVDYFIQNNNLLILNCITEHLLYSKTKNLTPSTRLKILEKIIKHELSLDIQSVSKHYTVLVKNIKTQSNLVVAEKPIKLISFQNYIVMVTDKHNSVPLVSLHGDSTALLLNALDAIEPTIIKKWARLKKSEHLFKMIDKRVHADGFLMIGLLMRPSWLQTSWALDLLESMVDKALVLFKVEYPLEEYTRGRPHFAIIHSFLYAFYEGFGETNNKSKFKLPTAITLRLGQILEKIIFKLNTNTHWDDNIKQIVNLQPAIQHYYANKYFNGAEDFSIPQLRQRIQKFYQQPASCAKLLDDNG